MANVNTMADDGEGEMQARLSHCFLVQSALKTSASDLEDGLLRLQITYVNAVRLQSPLLQPEGGGEEGDGGQFLPEASR